MGFYYIRAWRLFLLFSSPERPFLSCEQNNLRTFSFPGPKSLHIMAKLIIYGIMEI